MEHWFDPLFYGNLFLFSRRREDNAALSEPEAIELAVRAFYQERWPNVRIIARYGLYDEGGRGKSLILPPEFPNPPVPPERPDSFRSEEYMAWARQRHRWDREAERVGQAITHRNRLVWIVAFIGIVERHDLEVKVRLKVIDDESRRVLSGYQTPVAAFWEGADYA